MDDVTRRQAMKFAATTGVITTGAVALGGGKAHAVQDDGEAEDYGYTDVEATPEEQQAFEAFQANRPAGLVAEEFVDAIPIPYAFPIGAINIVGVLYLRDPIESSSTQGAVAGAVIGTYNLDRNRTDVTLYDPTGNLLKLELNLNFGERRLRGRLCNRRITGGWRCSPWHTLASW